MIFTQFLQCQMAHLCHFPALSWAPLLHVRSFGWFLEYHRVCLYRPLDLSPFPDLFLVLGKRIAGKQPAFDPRVDCCGKSTCIACLKRSVPLTNKCVSQTRSRSFLVCHAKCVTTWTSGSRDGLTVKWTYCRNKFMQPEEVFEHNLDSGDTMFPRFEISYPRDPSKLLCFMASTYGLFPDSSVRRVSYWPDLPQTFVSFS